VKADGDALADLIARETGKPLWEARTEVEAVIYADPACMAPYLDGILLSQLLWRDASGRSAAASRAAALCQLRT